MGLHPLLPPCTASGGATHPPVPGDSPRLSPGWMKQGPRHSDSREASVTPHAGTFAPQGTLRGDSPQPVSHPRSAVALGPPCLALAPEDHPPVDIPEIQPGGQRRGPVRVLMVPLLEGGALGSACSCLRPKHPEAPAPPQFFPRPVLLGPVRATWPGQCQEGKLSPPLLRSLAGRKIHRTHSRSGGGRGVLIPVPRALV